MKLIRKIISLTFMRKKFRHQQEKFFLRVASPEITLLKELSELFLHIHKAFCEQKHELVKFNLYVNLNSWLQFSVNMINETWQRSILCNSTGIERGVVTMYHNLSLLIEQQLNCFVDKLNKNAKLTVTIPMNATETLNHQFVTTKD